MNLMALKIYICHEEIRGPWGGSNQFVRFFKIFLKNQNIYTDAPDQADVILFISSTDLSKVIRLRRKYPNKLFLHRIDGPTRLYNHEKDKRDALIYWANSCIADATVFQSNWSKRKNYEMGMVPGVYSKVILNATSSIIFNAGQPCSFSSHGKIKVVMVSWSDNMKKGFASYQWLDENLDHARYKLSFVGNTPVEFKEIRCYQPKSSQQLADFLNTQDIYITASEKDPCSNALIEAMSCGLPAIAKNDGGHPEIVKGGGELFSEPHEIPPLLDKIVGEYHQYQESISVPTMREMGDQYLKFIHEVINQVPRRPKKVTKMAMLKLARMKFANRLSKG